MSVAALSATAQTWLEVRQEAKPGTRWWWMGSSVDSVNLTRNLETYAKAGIGAIEITPIYGVIGNEKNDIDFLSARWMKMLGHTLAEGKRLGIQVDMNTGTGWPFGGPEVTAEEAATCAYFLTWKPGEQEPALNERQQKNFPEKVGVYSYGDTLNVAFYIAKTRQQVKRAAPGGEGYVMDHLNPKAVSHYFERFDKAFAASGVSAPATFFNDSYEVYEADWTPALLTEFEARRGYKLEDKFPQFLDEAHPEHGQVISDYRETVSDLLLEVFTASWREWAHSHKSYLGGNTIIRNQAHGSPANLLDVYAAVDIPEIEGFGLSDFGIVGLRKDSLTKKNDSDLSMLKYPASVAHFYGKPFVSAETFTWLTEHFRTSLSQCKPDFDLMMVAGVNHCYFHGTTYSPAEAAWPGHLFYASVEMSPINSIWADAPAFFKYITRVQSWMQYGKPDNDLLVYLPVYDIWHEYPGRLLQFDIHSMAKKAPKFIAAVNSIYNAGYDMDYCSDRMINAIKGVNANGEIIAPSGVTYKALVLPEVKRMPAATRARIDELKSQGAVILEIATADGYLPALTQAGATHKALRPETMRNQFGLRAIRRSNDKGFHYFISSLQDHGVEGWIKLATPAASAYRFDALTGKVETAPVRKDANGETEVYLSLASGESCVLQTITDGPAVTSEAKTLGDAKVTIDLTQNKWTLAPTQQWTSFETCAPQTLKSLAAWTTLDKSWQTARGTARYTTTVSVNAKQLKLAQRWILDLGDVRESAHVYVNGKDAGVAFCAPFRLDITDMLQKGKNEIVIDVTGLVANYIAEMDRRGIEWRIFKNSNIVDLNYKGTKNWGYWETMPSGLNSTVTITGF